MNFIPFCQHHDLHHFLNATVQESLSSCLLLLCSASVFVSGHCCHGNINPKHQTKARLKTFTASVRAYATHSLESANNINIKQHEEGGRVSGGSQSEGFAVTPGNYEGSALEVSVIKGTVLLLVNVSLVHTPNKQQNTILFVNVHFLSRMVVPFYDS